MTSPVQSGKYEPEKKLALGAALAEAEILAEEAEAETEPDFEAKGIDEVGVDVVLTFPLEICFVLIEAKPVFIEKVVVL